MVEQDHWEKLLIGETPEEQLVERLAGLELKERVAVFGLVVELAAQQIHLSEGTAISKDLGRRLGRACLALDPLSIEPNYPRFGDILTSEDWRIAGNYLLGEACKLRDPQCVRITPYSATP